MNFISPVAIEDAIERSSGHSMFKHTPSIKCSYHCRIAIVRPRRWIIVWGSCGFLQVPYNSVATVRVWDLIYCRFSCLLYLHVLKYERSSICVGQCWALKPTRSSIKFLFHSILKILIPKNWFFQSLQMDNGGKNFLILVPILFFVLRVLNSRFFITVGLDQFLIQVKAKRNLRKNPGKNSYTFFSQTRASPA